MGFGSSIFISLDLRPSHVLVNGETTTLDSFIEQCGQGDIAGKPDFDKNLDYPWVTPLHNAYSKNFQWLPCEVDISTENSRCALLLFQIKEYDA